MSRSRRTRCTTSRKRCWVCTNCKQYGRRLREKQSAREAHKEAREHQR